MHVLPTTVLNNLINNNYRPGPLEVHDNRRRSSYEKSSLQIDASAEHALHSATPVAPHGDAATEQATRAVGVAQLLTALHLQELLHFRTVVQCSVRHYW